MSEEKSVTKVKGVLREKRKAVRKHAKWLQHAGDYYRIDRKGSIDDVRLPSSTVSSVSSVAATSADQQSVVREQMYTENGRPIPKAREVYMHTSISLACVSPCVSPCNVC